MRSEHNRFRYEERFTEGCPGGKYCDKALEEVSRPSSASCCDTSDAVTAPEFARSRTANDSRIVCKCAGGMEERGSFEARTRCVVGTGGRDGDGSGEAAFTVAAVEAVVLRANAGRRVGVSLS